MKKKRVIIGVLVFLSYLFFINVISNMNLNLNAITHNEKTNEGILEIGMDIQGTASLESQRFYGKIHQTGETKNLLLLNFLPIPLKTENFKYFYVVHILFIFIFLATLLKGGLKSNERKTENFDDGFVDGNNRRGFGVGGVEYTSESSNNNL